MRRRFRTAVLCAVLAITTAISLAGAPHPVCRLMLQEERNDREDLELAHELAESRESAAREIYMLLEKLWSEDAVERLVYLTGQHDLEVAKLERARLEVMLQREDALIDQLELLCSDDTPDELSREERDAWEQAAKRYEEADCGRLLVEIQLAKSDVAYHKEVLDSVVELREAEVATRQDVVIAERDLDMARRRLELGLRRIERCRKQPAPESDGD